MNITQIVAAVVIVVLAAILIIYKIKKQGLRKTAIALIVEAETTFQNGQAKLEMVVGAFISTLRFPFNKIPASMITKFIQSVFNEIKDALHCKGFEEQHISEDTDK